MAVSQTFYFYDLETSGISPRTARIMQFAGQRTSLSLEPIGEPDNLLVRMTDDTLPEPDAVMLTGITPQATIVDGISEADFLQYFMHEIALPGTIFVGFNTVRFDDEFIRYALYRNFYDAYEWAWKDDRSRWDVLDAVRMMRALRPDGIEWPVDDTGKPTNRLELLTSLNKLTHEAAHDALSDVNATIAVANMIRTKQPKLFGYLLKMRDKSQVAKLVMGKEPFLYTSGKYASQYEKTTIVRTLGEHPGQGGGALVYDLRNDPGRYAKMDPTQLAAAMQARPQDELERFPVKTLKFNRCPAIAPLGVLDEASIKRLKLDMKQIAENEKTLVKLPDFYDKLVKAIGILEQNRVANQLEVHPEVDARLYDGFFENNDKTKMAVVRAAGEDEIRGLDLRFDDDRLGELLPLYKARNFPNSLSDEEREAWESFRYNKLMEGGENSVFSRYFKRLGELADDPALSPEKRFLLEELQLYGESILPVV